jgi:hypothetical protein
MDVTNFRRFGFIGSLVNLLRWFSSALALMTRNLTLVNGERNEIKASWRLRVFVVVVLAFTTKKPRHKHSYFFGSDGRSSTRLGRARGSISSKSTTTSATSSGHSFHVFERLRSFPWPNSVFTEPGMT